MAFLDAGVEEYAPETLEIAHARREDAGGVGRDHGLRQDVRGRGGGEGQQSGKGMILYVPARHFARVRKHRPGAYSTSQPPIRGASTSTGRTDVRHVFPVTWACFVGRRAAREDGAVEEGRMAWRDDEARAALIREAAGTMRPGGAPPSFAELLFGRTTLEDLATYDAASLAVLAEEAWTHVTRRRPGQVDVRIVNPVMPDGREISVIEILNDNMPFLFDSALAELTEQGIEAKLVAHPILAVERDAEGRLTHFFGDALTQAVAKGKRESLIHIHVDRIDAEADRAS